MLFFPNKLSLTGILIPTKNSKAIDLKLVIEEIPVMIQCIIIMKIKSDKIMNPTELVGNWVLSTSTNCS